jgi:magnesium transporter
MRKIERKIFEGKESLMVREISETHRRILDIKQAIRFHEETLRTFSSASKQFFGPEFTHDMETVASEYYKVASTLDGHKELLKDLKETNDSLLSTKTNQVMKVLTFITFTALPFTLTAGILGMNAPFTTNISAETVLFVFGIASLIGIGVYIYFRKRNWL